MRIVKTLIEMKIYDDLILRRDEEYVMAGAVLKQLSKIYPGGIIETGNFDDHYRPINVKTLEKNKRLFIFRSGGIGDVMFMLPLIRFLKKQFGTRIKAGTSPQYRDVLQNNPYIDEIISVPFLLREMDTDYHLMFEGIIEDPSEKPKKYHAVDLFLEEAGVNPEDIPWDEKIPPLFLSQEEKTWSKNRLSKLDIPLGAKIGIQVQASSPVRTFPLDKTVGIIKLLINQGNNIFLFGGPRQAEFTNYLTSLLGEARRLINLVHKDITLRQSIIWASMMDLIIAPDSAFIHIAGSLGVPLIGLYGCFPSLLRMKYYRNAIGIDCNVACAPSFIHGHLPCYKGDPSPCFSVVKVQNVLDAVEHILGIKKIPNEYPAYNEFRDSVLSHSPFIQISEALKETAGLKDGN